MWMPSYLQRNRYGVYYFRRAIPKQIRNIVGKSEIVFSLHTRNTCHAKSLARLNAVRVDQYFAEVCMSKKDSEDFNLGFITKSTLLDGTTIEQETTPTDIAALREAGLSPSEIADVIKTVHSSTPIQKPSKQSKELTNSTNHKDDITVQTLIDDFVNHWEAERGGKNIPAVQMTKLRRLNEMLGTTTPISSVSRESAEVVRQHLGMLPANSRSYRKLSVPEIINRTRDLTIDRLSNKSRNDHLELYTRLFKYSQQKYPKLTPINPFDGVRVIVNAKERVEKARRAFSRDHIKKIFSTPLYTKPDLSLPYRYWTPLVGLFTGARRGSISTLFIKDIKRIDDIWVFDFNENEDVKREKTVNGFRLTPIHPILIQLGFLDYVNDLSKKDNSRLFPDLKNWTEKELYGRPIGDWFNGSGNRRPGYLHKLGIRGKKREYVFHSFRHTLTTELRRVGADVLTIEQICGRTDGAKTTGQQYYTERDKLSFLYETISKLDFSHELSEVESYKPKM